MSVLYRGVVKWFNDAKGFGFVEHSNGKDVFVHYSVIEWDGFKTLKDGEEVEYELTEGDKGLHAKRVVRLKQKQAPQDSVATDNTTTETTHAPYQSISSMIEIERTPTEKEENQDTQIAPGTTVEDPTYKTT
jgi:cold shock protein